MNAKEMSKILYFFIQSSYNARATLGMLFLFSAILTAQAQDQGEIEKVESNIDKMH
jgi:hypothetical protein